MFSYDAVASGAPDPAVFAGRVPVQARERKGTFFTTWSPLAVAPIVVPPPPTTFMELLPTLGPWERALFDTCQFLVPYHKVLHIRGSQKVGITFLPKIKIAFCANDCDVTASVLIQYQLRMWLADVLLESTIAPSTGSYVEVSWTT